MAAVDRKSERVGRVVVCGVLLFAMAATAGPWLLRVLRTPRPLPVRQGEPPRPRPQAYLELSEAIEEVAAAVAALPRQEHPSVASLQVQLRFLRTDTETLLEGWHGAGEADLRQRLAALRHDLALAKAGRPRLAAGQTYVMGYWSRLDDSYQPFALSVPPEYDGTRPFPLLLFLHGQGMYKTRQYTAPLWAKTIVAGPQGRGGMDYMFVAEDDIFRVIEAVQQVLKVDAERISLAGSSMGGTGCWHLATRYPDRFAGIAATSGLTDAFLLASHWRDGDAALGDGPQAAVKRFLRADTSALTYATNLLNLGVVAAHGEADPVNPHRHMLEMAAALKALGHPKTRFQNLRYVQHGFSFYYPAAVEPFRLQRRPLEVRHKTAWLRYGQAYWLRITGLAERLKHALVSGRATGTALSLATANVSELTIDPARLPLDGPLARVQIDDTRLAAGAAAADGAALVFHRAVDGAWRPGRRPAPAAFPPRKSARVEGPIEHAYMSRFLVVVPSRPAAPSPSYEAAVRAGKQVSDLWKQRFGVPCRAKWSDRVTAADVADSNLILFGGPEDNSLTKQVLDRLPLRLAGDAVVLGPRRYTGENVGVQLCYPNPLNPERYVVLYAGTTPASYCDAVLRFGHWFDWVPFYYRPHYDFAVFDDASLGRRPESFLVWGFFDDAWQFCPQTTFTGESAFRRPARPRTVPTWTQLALQQQSKSLPAELPLAAVVPLASEPMREYVERNRTTTGGPLLIGGQSFATGLYCPYPCTLVFPCAGFRRFKAVGGSSWDGKTPLGQARQNTEDLTVRVYADERLVFAAERQSFRTPPLGINVDIGGARTLRLEVSGGSPWVDGAYIWAQARLCRERTPLEAFAVALPLWRGDGKNGFSGVEATAQATCAADATGLTVAATGGDPQLLLPPLPDALPGDVLLAFDLTAPAPTVLQVYFRSAGERNFREEKSVRVEVPAGRSQPLVRIPRDDVAGRVRFDPGAVAGQYVLHAVEARVLDR